MPEPSPEELSAAYRALRTRTIALGRGLDTSQASVLSPCCPDWSVKDLFAHMVGVPSDILEGNVEGAATEAWADAQVERRSQLDLGAVLDEWEEKGPPVDELLGTVGPTFPFEFFLDAWTHEWDIRQAVDAEAAPPDYSLVAHTVAPLMERLGERLSAAALEPVDLVLRGLPTGPHQASFDGAPSARHRPTAAIDLTLFEFLRVAMGRRSGPQIEAALGTDGLSEDDWADAFVFWSINDADIIDPVIL